MSTVDDLIRQNAADQEAIAALKRRLSHATSYTERANLLKRIRALQDDQRALYAKLLKAEGHKPATVFGTTKKPRIYAGLAVRMDISDDGLFFSNPSPRLAHGQRAWVRCIIDMAQKSPFSTVKTVMSPFVRLTWVIPHGWTSLDIYPRFGRNEFFISTPLIVTREFHAPSSGSTRGSKFGVYVDPYYPVDALSTDNPASGAIITDANIVAHLDAGTYRIYSRAANVLDSATDHAIGDSDWQVADGDVHLYYTDGATYLNVREIFTGPFAGKYFITGQDGVTLTDETEED